MQVERQGAKAEAYSHMFPHVIGGVCEFCGVIDNLQPSTEQYKLCPHFKNMGELRCSYCPETANPTEIVYHADLKIHTHPDNPTKVVVVCDSYNCSQAHLKRFQRNLA